MVEFPLLPIPDPEISPRPAGRGVPNNLNLPDQQRQVQRIGPIFQRLQNVLNSGLPELRQDPASIAPERALVFEIAGTINNFYKAVDRIEGLEFLGEGETTFDPDEDFHIVDTRRGRKGDVRYDKLVGGQLYLAMPDIRALQELVSLWNRYKDEKPFEHGFANWRKVFEQLSDIRPWGPQDRIPQEMIDYLRTELADQPQQTNVKLEVELWSYRSSERRRQAFDEFQEAVHISGGEIIHRSSIQEIAYEAALIDLPISEVNSLLQREEVGLVICDDVMYIRPQSTISLPPIASKIVTGIRSVEPLLPEEDSPIAGLFDGVPVQVHRLLDGHLVLDDPDNLNEISSPTKRYHGTGMASLIIHGDLNRSELSIQHPIYIRPVLYASGNDKDERIQRDRLLVDTIYRAVMRMRFGDGDEEEVAPNVFIVNLSIGDRTRPFANHISPLGRLLDYLAFRYDILFIVSAGNVHEPLLVSALQGNEDLDSPEFRQRAILQALGDQRSQRTLLSPAEAINVITVGSWYADSVETDLLSHNYEPYIEEGPNISSGQGLGYKGVIKPDIFMPGGRERFQVVRKNEQGISIQPVPAGRIYGLGVAIPDPNGLLDKQGLMSGTSVATALATRSAHMLFDFLIGNDEGVLAGMDPEFYAVVIKALLVHRARWSEEISCLLESISKSNDTSHYIERRDNIARLLGYGYPVIEESINCASNRATLVGYGEILPSKDSRQFRIPLPPSLDRVTEPRSITLTLAWFSPVNVRSQTYRRAKLEIKPDNFKEKAGVSRFRLQPSDKSVPRGTIFHTHYKGCRAVEFVDDGNLNFKVFCREQGGLLDQPIRYGLAFTIEAGEKIPVYQEIRERLAIRPRVSGYTV